MSERLLFRILVLDDEETILGLYEQILSSENPIFDSSNGLPTFNLTCCRQGEEGIEQVKNALAEKDPYAVVFLDIHMPPGRDGVYTAGEIRKLDPDVGIVLVTGHARINILKTARSLLPMDKLLYLQKPFYPQEILQFASALSEKWRVEKKYRSIRKNLEQMVANKTESLSKTNKQLSEEIAQRSRAEKAMQVSEANFRKIIKNNSDGIVIVDTGGIVRFINPAAEILLNTSLDHFVGKTFGFPIATNQTSEIEIIGHHAQSTVCEMRVVKSEWKGEEVYLASIRDVSERHQMEKKITDSLTRYRAAMEGTIMAMATIVETRDPYTSGHQQRVARLSRDIAKKIGLSTNQIDGIYLTGLIHDIGKISVPAEILSKPGRLSEVEFLLIKGHPESGYDILKGIEFPWPVAQITRQHHERLDGSGYPQKLKGDDILIEARIMSVADVVEAMATHRPYRPALGIDAALDEIRSKKGTFYDSQAVDACLQLNNEGQIRF